MKELLSQVSEAGALQTPEMLRSNPEKTAGIIMAILSQNYGVHNLTANIEPIIDEIRCGNMQPFIQNEGDIPVACAALIKLNHTDVEIGRGACLPGKNGGKSLPLMEAFRSWEQQEIFPDSQILRAEVRTAKPTKEVQGGQATQIICLKHIGLKPTAFGPFFHHGMPDRQETFLLASKFREQNVAFTQIPDLPLQIFSNQSEALAFIYFWENYFGFKPTFTDTDSRSGQNIGFSIDSSGPFIEAKADSSFPENLDSLERHFDQQRTFAISKIKLLKNADLLTPATNSLKENGFHLVGFQPLLEDGQVDVEIIFGRLSAEAKDRMVLPSFAEGVFPHNIEDALTHSALCWRKHP